MSLSKLTLTLIEIGGITLAQLVTLMGMSGMTLSHPKLTLTLKEIG